VVCLREAREGAQRRARWLSAGFFVAVLAVCGVLLASRSLRAPSTPQASAPFTALSAEPPSGAAAPTEQPRQSPEPPPSAANAANEPESDSAPASSAASAALAPAASIELAPSARPPTPQEVQAAFHATPVLMFSTNWCPVCARARKFFQANGLAFVDRDVDADPAASAELKRRSGGKAIPLIDIDGQQLEPGFSEQATMQAVASSVQRRLGVTGVRLVPASSPN